MDQYFVAMKGKLDGEKLEVIRQIIAPSEERAEEWGKKQAEVWRWHDIKTKATKIIT